MYTIFYGNNIELEVIFTVNYIRQKKKKNYWVCVYYTSSCFNDCKKARATQQDQKVKRDNGFPDLNEEVKTEKEEHGYSCAVDILKENKSIM